MEKYNQRINTGNNFFNIFSWLYINNESFEVTLRRQSTEKPFFATGYWRTRVHSELLLQIHRMQMKMIYRCLNSSINPHYLMSSKIYQYWKMEHKTKQENEIEIQHLRR